MLNNFLATERSMAEEQFGPEVLNSNDLSSRTLKGQFGPSKKSNSILQNNLCLLVPVLIKDCTSG